MTTSEARPAVPAIWSPDSWRTKTALQQPTYRDAAAVRRVLGEIATLPPLVTSWEVLALKQQLAEAQEGQRFVLQGGDCAESFSECTSASITAKLKILLQMSLVLIQGSRKPVTRIGRFAGQYAKPRSEDLETRDGVSLPAYRGDIVNRSPFNAADREPDPQLLLRGYERSALTLNFVRALVKGGFADLHHPEYWDLAFAENSPLAGEYHRITSSIAESLQFMESILGVKAGELDRVDFFTSHEGLHLGYEEALTRRVPRREGWFNLSAHFPWVGLRTSAVDGAHIEYFRGIVNPIGLKIGATTTPEQLARLVETLNPADEPGRLTLIHRFGVRHLADKLPCLIRAIRRAGRKVLWICDPMHGNTRVTAEGIKTRSFEDIRHELETAFDVHAAEGSYLGGVHIELTGGDVTECTGGARGLTDHDLKLAYLTEVDPRLNWEQALEIAMLVAHKMARSRA